MVRRTRDEWSKLVEEYRRSGESAAVFASRRRLNARTLAWWSSRLGRAPGVGFAEVEVAAALSPPSLVRVDAALANGVRVGIEVIGERQALGVVLAALGALR